jgi:PAS domain S-box-containing protein
MATIKQTKAELLFENKQLKKRIAELTDGNKNSLSLGNKESHQFEPDYRRIFNEAHDPIVVFEPEDEIILDVNELAIEIYGYKRSELIGMSLKKISKFVSRGEDNIKNTLKKGTHKHFETTHFRKDGSEILLEINASVIKYMGQKAILSINRDITERKKAEIELHKSEERFRRLAENAPEIIYRFRISPDPGFEFINPAVTEIAGYTPQEHYNNPELGFHIIHPEDRIKLNGLFKGIIPKYPHQVRWIRKDGKIIWMEDRTTPIYNEKGELIAIEGIAREITEQREAEEALRESEKKFREMADLSPLVVYEIDINANLTFFNKQASVIFGFSEHDLMSNFNVLDRVIPEDRVRARENMKKIMNGKSLSNTEYTMIRKDGSTFPALVNSNPVFKDDKPVGLRGIIVDITERKLAENKIKESQQRLSSHLNNTPLGSIFWDIDFKVIEWNSSAERIFGYNKEEALGRHPYSLIVPKEIQGQIDYVFSQLLSQTGGSRSVNENVTKDGKRILCDWYNVAITDLDDNVTGVASLVDDITEQKETERKLKESRNQLRSLAERLQMIREEERSAVSREIHDDLGQVLTALKMDISSLQNKSNVEPSELTDRTDKMLELVNSSIQTVKRIATELRPGILDDLGLFSAVEWQVEEFQNRTKINCQLDLEGEIDLIDDEVSIAVFRIFQETLTNITRHSHATHTEVKILCSGNDLIMDVEDNGKGISIEELNSSMSLGIIGMRERVNILRGEFEVSGDPGKGTKVHVKIPLRKKEIV